MPIYQQGSLNTAALVVPDLYVQIVPPQNLVLNGVPTNLVGLVGGASWGPVNQPVTVGGMVDYARNFGPVLARKYDLGTQVATCVQQGAQAFRCVRVTDGTDSAANYAIGFTAGTYTVLLNARYSGSLGNQIGVTLGSGSQVGTWRLTLALPGLTPEVFDNLAAPTPNALWANLVAAVNLGNGPLRGPSQLVVASIGAGAGSPPSVMVGQFLQGGTDGTSGLTSTLLVGQDALPRRGMYVLRGQGCSVAALADADDSTQWTTQAQFGAAEGIYMILVGPVGDTITNAVAAKQQAGLDSPAAKLMFGDWIYWNDTANAQIRLVSPQGFVAGRLGNLSPEQSSLNKPLYSVIGSQRSGAPNSGQTASYSSAELQLLFGTGIDVISNPQPGGAYWGVRCGHNSSSSASTNGDNYTRMTNFLAATLVSGMGQYVGQVINAGLFRRVRATQLSFLQNLLGQGILGSTDGNLPFSVVCDVSNNPQSRTSLGYVQCDVQVQYQGINEKFVVNMEGGQTVTVNRQTLPTGLAS